MTAKQPYTGPSQVVTTDTRRTIYVDVFQKARRMTVYSGAYKGRIAVSKSNLSPENHPGLWAIVNLLRDEKTQVSSSKFYVRLTFEELASADEPLAAWVRQETTNYLFRKEHAQHHEASKARRVVKSRV